MPGSIAKLAVGVPHHQWVQSFIAIKESAIFWENLELWQEVESNKNSNINNSRMKLSSDNAVSSSSKVRFKIQTNIILSYAVKMVLK